MRLNNFDFLRIAAALLVMYSHQYALQGLVEPFPPLPHMSWGGFGVLMFFSISGFLVAKSWCDDPRPIQFLARRFLRIWPALAVVVALSVFVLGPSISDLTLSNYWTSRDTWTYLATLKVFVIKFNLPGVFAHNPLPDAVNGSLWTIPIEVRCYLVLMILGWVGALKMPWLMACATLTIAFVTFAWLEPGLRKERNWSYELGIFFAAGAVLYLIRGFWTRHVKQIFFVVSAGGFSLWLGGWSYAAIFLVLPFAVVAFGNASTPVIRSFGRFGDPSYGLYIYAFPIQQLIVQLTSNHTGVYASLSVAVSATVCVAYCSWHFVEKKALRLKPVRRVSLLDGLPSGNNPQPAVAR